MLLLPGFLLSAQQWKEDKTVDETVETLEKTNRKVQKSLLMLEERLYKKAGALSLEKVGHKADSLLKSKEIGMVRDTMSSFLASFKQKLVDHLETTPPNLPVAGELLTTSRQLDKLRALQQDLVKAGSIKDGLRGHELSKLERRFEHLTSALEPYKAMFDGWEEQVLAEVTSLEAVKLAKEQIDKMEVYNPLPEGYREQMGRFQTNNFVRDKLEKKAEELKQSGMKTLQEKLDEAQVRVAETKQKFPSLESVKDAPKRYNPYRGLPLMKRLKPGGNAQINREPVSLDAALSLAYPISQKASLGFETAGRLNIEQTSGFQASERMLSFRSFGRYRPWKHFFIQANYEFNRMESQALADAAPDHRWTRTALVGIGREIGLTHRLKIQLTTFYNFFHDSQESPYPQALVFRIGLSQ